MFFDGVEDRVWLMESIAICGRTATEMRVRRIEPFIAATLNFSVTCLNSIDYQHLLGHQLIQDLFSYLCRPPPRYNILKNFAVFSALDWLSVNEISSWSSDDD